MASSNTAAVGIDRTAYLPLVWGSTLCRRTWGAEATRVKAATDIPLLSSLSRRAGDTRAVGVEFATDLGPKLGEESQSLVKDAVDPRNLTLRRGQGSPWEQANYEKDEDSDDANGSRRHGFLLVGGRLRSGRHGYAGPPSRSMVLLPATENRRCQA